MELTIEDVSYVKRKEKCHTSKIHKLIYATSILFFLHRVHYLLHTCMFRCVALFGMRENVLVWGCRFTSARCAGWQLSFAHTVISFSHRFILRAVWLFSNSSRTSALVFLQFGLTTLSSVLEI